MSGGVGDHGSNGDGYHAMVRSQLKSFTMVEWVSHKEKYSGPLK